jgi:hypothetical protein
LRIRVEDDIGPRVPEDEPTPGTEEEIDLGAFYEEFIAAGRGVVEITAEADGPSAKANLTRLIKAIVTDRHQC